MEDLNNTQLVLLTLFVSFVTSMATGIITVTLLEQAPVAVTQTINRVVERTIERVTTPDVKPVIPQPNQEELITRVVSQSTQSLLRIYVSDIPLTDVGTSTPLGEFRGMGFVVSKDGVVATAHTLLIEEAKGYVGVSKSGERIPLMLHAVSTTRGVALLVGASASLRALPPLAVAETGIALGKTVIAPALGTEVDTVAVGSVSGLKVGTASSTPILETTLSFRAHQIGGPLLDTRGLVIGMVTGEEKVAHARTIKDVLVASREALDSTTKNR